MLSLLSCRRDAPQERPTAAAYASTASESEAIDPLNTALPVFVNITAEAGIDFTHCNGATGKKWMPETVGAGGGFFDYDGDGDADILLANGCEWPGHKTLDSKPTPKLYRNDGTGHFDDITVQTGLSEISFYGMGLAAADYDGDGDCDLFLTGLGRNILLRNDEGRYCDVTTELLVCDSAERTGEVIPDWSTGVAWFDYDLDGDLDLFVCNYVAWSSDTDVYTTLDGTHKSYSMPQVYRGRTCRLFENRGGGRLADVSAAAGVLNDQGKSMSVLTGDFNQDHLLDIFVTNDTEPNFLYLNRGAGRFEEVGLLAGCGYDEHGRARAGMGVAAADLTNDGSLSIAIGNFSKEPVSLYERLGDMEMFVDAAGRAGISRPTLLTLTFGLVFADFDLDGWTDLMLANGHIEPEISTVQTEITFAQNPKLLRGNGSGRFDDISDRVGDDFAAPVVARALSCADIDQDGDLDVLLTVNGGRPRLLRNDLPADNHAIRVRLRGAGRNPDAVGALVTVSHGGMRQTRAVHTGGSYLSQSEFVQCIGLGQVTVAEVEVRWPNGEIEKLGKLDSGYTYTIVYGRGVTARERFAKQRSGA